MTIETFRGTDLSRVLATVRAVCGDEAMILRTRGPSENGSGEYEVLVAQPEQIEHFRKVLEGAPVKAGRRRKRKRFVQALVGPAGAGKTTTLAKLAMHKSGYGGRNVGLLTLDTYRVAALEQLQTYADIGGLMFDVAYNTDEVDAALRRMDGCDVILVDTPGRGARPGREQEWMSLLAHIVPDEVHLVVPAGMRCDVAVAAARAYAPCAITHLLLTKLDEVPAETGVAELAEALRLPARWLCDGPDVPFDMAAAPPRIMRSLGTFAAIGRAV